MVIKTFDPIACGKVSGLIYAAMGFLSGLMFTGFALLGAVGGIEIEVE